MQVIKMSVGLLATNTYIVYDENTLECVIIDPAAAEPNICMAIQYEKLEPKAILITHGHFDHVGGVNMMRKVYGDIPVYMHQGDDKMSTDAAAAYMGQVMDKPADKFINDGDIIKEAGLEFKVIHTPGHSPGSVCYICEDSMFSGDTVFCMSIGRIDLPYSDWNDMKASIKKLLETIDRDYVLHSGHGESSSFEQERANNPYLNGTVQL